MTTLPLDRETLLGTKLTLTVSAATGEIERETIEVVRPPGPVRQREQLVRTVKDRFGQARLHGIIDGVAIFTCANYVIRAAYE